MDSHRQAHFEACSELIECNESEKTFLSHIVTGDKISVHHREPEAKRSSMKWRYPTSPELKNSQVSVKLEKLWQLHFRTLKKLYWLILCLKVPPSHADAYIDTLHKMKVSLKRS